MIKLDDPDTVVRELRLGEIKPGMSLVFQLDAGDDYESTVESLMEWGAAHDVEILVLGPGVALLGSTSE